MKITKIEDGNKSETTINLSDEFYMILFIMVVIIIWLMIFGVTPWL